MTNVYRMEGGSKVKVGVSLLSRTTEEGVTTLVYYKLNKDEYDRLMEAVYNDNQFLPFGQHFHNAADVIEFELV